MHSMKPIKDARVVHDIALRKELAIRLDRLLEHYLRVRLDERKRALLACGPYQLGLSTSAPNDSPSIQSPSNSVPPGAAVFVLTLRP